MPSRSLWTAIVFGLIAVVVFAVQMAAKVNAPDDDYLATLTTLAHFAAAGDLYDNWHGVNYLVYWFRPLIIIPGALFKLWPSAYVPVLFNALLYGAACGCGVGLIANLLGYGRRFIVMVLLLLWLGCLMLVKTPLLMLPVLLALQARHWRYLAASALLLLMDSPLAGVILLPCGVAALIWIGRPRVGIVLLLAGMAAIVMVVYAHGILLPQPFLPQADGRPLHADLLADGLRATQTMVIMLALVLVARASTDSWAATLALAAGGFFVSTFVVFHGCSAERHDFVPVPDARAISVIRQYVPDRSDMTFAVPGALIPQIVPTATTNAFEEHDQPFGEDWVLLDTRLPVGRGMRFNGVRNLLRLVRQVECEEYGVVHAADDIVLLKRGQAAQPPAEFYASLDRMLARVMGDTVGFAHNLYEDKPVCAGRVVDAGGVLIPLPAGVLRLNSAERITTLGISNAALGKQARLPWPDNCRFSEVLFIPLEVLAEGENELTVTLWNGSMSVATKTIIVACDLNPPRLARTDGNDWQASDNSNRLRVFLWQPARAPRLLTGNFRRLENINAWSMKDVSCEAQPSLLPVDQSLLLPEDMLWLEDGAGHIAIYARENGDWRLLGTKYAGYNPDTEGLPTAWEMAAPLMPQR